MLIIIDYKLFVCFYLKCNSYFICKRYTTLISSIYRNCFSSILFQNKENLLKIECKDKSMVSFHFLKFLPDPNVFCFSRINMNTIDRYLS